MLFIKLFAHKKGGGSTDTLTKRAAVQPTTAETVTQNASA